MNPGSELAHALRLAREVEALLEEGPDSGAAPDSVDGASGCRPAFGGTSRPAHSTRIARAMAASLVDELEALVRAARPSVAQQAARPSGRA